MPDPTRQAFGLLRPLPVMGGLKALPGFSGFQQQKADITPYLPSQQQVDQAGAEEDNTPWWVKLLQVPDKLFGGQMLKGFLAGNNEAGIGDNIVEGIRKNPAFQLLDILNPFGDPLTGKTVSAADVRTALDLNFGQENVNEGWGNFAINMVGEILLDPSSFVMPFGKVAAGFKEAGQGLVKAVETGQKAMLVFKVPFAEGRFVFQPFKSLDLSVARGVEKWADFLNTHPVTKPVMQAFSRSAVGIKGAAKRFFVGSAVDSASEKATMATKPLVERMNKLANDVPEMFKDGSMQEAIYSIREHGIEGVDELSNARDIVIGQGREVRQARSRYRRFIKEDQGFQDLVARAENGDIVAGDVLYQSYPTTQLPEHILEMHNLPKRPGVEFRRQSPQYTVERNIQGIVQPGTEGTAARAGIEGGIAGLSGQTIAAGEEKVVDLFGRITKLDPKVQESLVSTAKELGSILDDAGMADVVSGFLNGMNELYLPRWVNPEIRQQVTQMFLGSVQKTFNADARKFSESFMKARGPLDEMDTLTANHLIRELGTKFTSNRPLKEFGSSEAEGILATAAKIFEPIMPAIRKLDPDVAQFFNTNPFLNTARRIEQSTKLHEKAYLNATLLAADSPLVYKSETLGEANATLASNRAPINPETGKPHRLLITNPKGNLLEQGAFGGPVDVGSAVNHMMRDDNIARGMIARRHIRDELHTRILENRTDFETAVKEMDHAVGINGTMSDLAPNPTDLGKVAFMKRLYKQRETASKANASAETLKWYDEQISTIKYGLVEEAKELRAAHADYIGGLKDVAADKRDMLRDVLSRRLTPSETREMIRVREMERGRGVLAIDELQKVEPEAYQRLVDKYKDSSAVWVDADVYDGLWGKNGYLEKLRRPDMLADRFGIKTYDRAQTWFKAWTLMPTPFVQTWFRDVVSGHMLQAMAGDVTPVALMGAQKDAIALSRSLKAGMRGDRTALDAIVIDRQLADGSMQQIKGGEIYDKMYGKGAVDASWWRDEMQMAGEEAAQGAGAAKGSWTDVFKGVLPPLLGSKWKSGLAGNPFHNPIIRKGAAWRSFLDNEVVASGVIARWKSGQTIDDAIDATKAFHYDPRKGLTSFERSKVRRMIPFYGFTKFAVTKTTELLMQKPGAVTFFQKLHDSATRAALGGPDAFDAAMPEFLKDNFGIPYNNTPDGPEFFALGNYIPVGELTRLTNAIEDSFKPENKGSLFTYAMERFDPFAKQTIEQAFNYSFYGQREIEQFPGEHTEMFGVAMSKKTANVIKSIRFLNELDRLNVVSLEDFSGLRLAAGEAVERGKAAGSDKQLSPLMRLLTGSFGPLPRGYLIDVANETRFRESQNEREMSMLKGKMRKRLEEPGKPGATADITQIQQLMAEIKAKEAKLDLIKERYQNEALTPR